MKNRKHCWTHSPEISIHEKRLGTAVGYLSNILLKSYEVADIEGRMEKIEKFIDEKFYKEA